MKHRNKYRTKRPRFKPQVGIWRKSQGNQTEIHGVAVTGKKYFTANYNLEKKSQRNQTNSRRHRGKIQFTRRHNLKKITKKQVK
jgi:hypothetical protein